MENLYNMWANRNPNFETRMQESLLSVYTDYGKGASELTSARGKVYGAGYELYIYAFFLGLYNNRQQSLEGEKKSFGHPIKFWSGSEKPINRSLYPKIRSAIFIALIAKAENLDLLALDRGEISPNHVVDILIDTMEKYANYGFYYMLEKINENPNYFYKTTGFLDPILEAVGIFETKNEFQLESLDD